MSAATLPDAPVDLAALRRGIAAEILSARRAGLPIPLERLRHLETLATTITVPASGPVQVPAPPPAAPARPAAPPSPAADDSHTAIFSAYLDALIRCHEATSPEEREAAQGEADRLWAMVHDQDPEAASPGEGYPGGPDEGPFQLTPDAAPEPEDEPDPDGPSPFGGDQSPITDDEADDLYQQAPEPVDTLATNPQEWEPHVITRGQRRGMHVYRNSRTGELADYIPGLSQGPRPAEEETYTHPEIMGGQPVQVPHAYKHVGQDEKTGQDVWQHRETGQRVVGRRPLSQAGAHERAVAHLRANRLRGEPSRTEPPRDGVPDRATPYLAGLGLPQPHKLFGDLPGTVARTYGSDPAKYGVGVVLTHPDVQSWSRTLRVENGDLVCSNHLFFLKPGSQGSGFGTKAFAAQVQAMGDAGVARILTNAGKGGTGAGKMNGFYTWAALGYDARLDPDWIRRNRKSLPAGSAPKTVQDLMATPEGRDLWKKRGYMTSMSFDLDPQGKSVAALNRYLERKGQPPVKIRPGAREQLRQRIAAGPPPSADPNFLDDARGQWAVRMAAAGMMGAERARVHEAADDILSHWDPKDGQASPDLVYSWALQRVRGSALPETSATPAGVATMATVSSDWIDYVGPFGGKGAYNTRTQERRYGANADVLNAGRVARPPRPTDPYKDWTVPGEELTPELRDEIDSRRAALGMVPAHQLMNPGQTPGQPQATPRPAPRAPRPQNPPTVETYNPAKHGGSLTPATAPAPAPAPAGKPDDPFADLGLGQKKAAPSAPSNDPRHNPDLDDAFGMTPNVPKPAPTGKPTSPPAASLPVAQQLPEDHPAAWVPFDDGRGGQEWRRLPVAQRLPDEPGPAAPAQASPAQAQSPIQQSLQAAREAMRKARSGNPQDIQAARDALNKHDRELAGSGGPFRNRGHIEEARRLLGQYQQAAETSSGAETDPPDLLRQSFGLGPKRAAPAATSPSKLPAPAADIPESPVREMPVSDLHVDPQRFQYKLHTNKKGVTNEFANTQVFDPEMAGTVAVWKDPADGKTYVVNGHHRHEMAARIPTWAKPGGADGETYTPTDAEKKLSVRYIHAPTAEAARAKGAMLNIAEKNGTAVDAAKFMRDRGVDAKGLESRGISLSGAVARDAVHLHGLSGPIFQRVATGQMDVPRAVAIGQSLAGRDDLQHQLVNYIDKRERDGAKWSPSMVAEAAREIAQAPTQTTDSGGLFGGTEEKSLLEERAALKAHVRSELARAVGDYKAVSSDRRAGSVAEAGNVLNTAANKDKAAESARMAELFDRSANYKGPVSDLINEYAEKYANAASETDRTRLKSDLARDIRPVLQRAGMAHPAAGGTGGGGASESPTGTALLATDAELLWFFSGFPDAVTMVWLNNDGWQRFVYVRGPKAGQTAGWQHIATGRKVYTVNETAPGYARRQVQASHRRATELAGELAAHQRGEEGVAAPTEAHLRELADHVQALPVHSLRSMKNLLMGTWGNVRRRQQMVEAIQNHVRGLVEKAAGTAATDSETAPAGPTPDLAPAATPTSAGRGLFDDLPEAPEAEPSAAETPAPDTAAPGPDTMGQAPDTAAAPATPLDAHRVAYQQARALMSQPGRAMGGAKMRNDVVGLVAKQHGVTPAEAEQMLDGGGEDHATAKPATGWDAVPDAGKEGFENHVLAPLRNQLEPLDHAAKTLGLRYAWEAATHQKEMPPGSPHAGTAGLERWKAAATEAGIDADALVAQHPEYQELAGRLDQYRSWGDKDWRASESPKIEAKDAPAPAPAPEPEPVPTPEPPPSKNHYLTAADARNGGSVSPEDADAAKAHYDSLGDNHAEKNEFARTLGVQGPEKALPATRDDLVHRTLREAAFRHTQAAKGLKDIPSLNKDGGLFGERGVGESGGLFDDHPPESDSGKNDEMAKPSGLFDASEQPQPAEPVEPAKAKSGPTPQADWSDTTGWMQRQIDNEQKTFDKVMNGQSADVVLHHRYTSPDGDLVGWIVNSGKRGYMAQVWSAEDKMRLKALIVPTLEKAQEYLAKHVGPETTKPTPDQADTVSAAGQPPIGQPPADPHARTQTHVDILSRAKADHPGSIPLLNTGSRVHVHPDDEQKTGIGPEGTLPALLEGYGGRQLLRGMAQGDHRPTIIHRMDGVADKPITGTPQATHDRLLSVITKHDLAESKKRGYNKNALGHYAKSLQNVERHVKMGRSIRDAILTEFNGPLADKLLGSIGIPARNAGERIGVGRLPELPDEEEPSAQPDESPPATPPEPESAAAKTAEPSANQPGVHDFHVIESQAENGKRDKRLGSKWHGDVSKRLADGTITADEMRQKFAELTQDPTAVLSSIMAGLKKNRDAVSGKDFFSGRSDL